MKGVVAFDPNGGNVCGAMIDQNISIGCIGHRHDDGRHGQQHVVRRVQPADRRCAACWSAESPNRRAVRRSRSVAPKFHPARHKQPSPAAATVPDRRRGRVFPRPRATARSSNRSPARPRVFQRPSLKMPKPPSKSAARRALESRQSSIRPRRPSRSWRAAVRSSARRIRSGPVRGAICCRARPKVRAASGWPSSYRRTRPRPKLECARA